MAHDIKPPFSEVADYVKSGWVCNGANEKKEDNQKNIQSYTCTYEYMHNIWGERYRMVSRDRLWTLSNALGSS